MAEKEYIERGSAINRLLSVVVTGDVFGMGIQSGVDHAIAVLNEAPAADVVEVVRCKDCAYWQDNNGGYPHKECRLGKGETPDSNDFCSHGERKEQTT